MLVILHVDLVYMFQRRRMKRMVIQRVKLLKKKKPKENKTLSFASLYISEIINQEKNKLKA